MTPTVPPNTTPFLIAGYGVLLGGIVLYVLTLVLRYRQALADRRFLDEIERSQ